MLLGAAVVSQEVWQLQETLGLSARGPDLLIWLQPSAALAVGLDEVLQSHKIKS